MSHFYNVDYKIKTKNDQNKILLNFNHLLIKKQKQEESDFFFFDSWKCVKIHDAALICKELEKTDPDKMKEL